MGWSGEAIQVTPSDIRATIKAIAEELGMVITCVCGAARWCPAVRAYEDSQTFWKLHAGHGARAGR